MIQCAIIGATGYTGIELSKILLRHRYVQISHLTTRQEKAIPLRSLIPQLPKHVNLKIQKYPLNEIKKKADVVFICLPHTEAAKTAAFFYRAGKLVIDLSADFRLKQPAVYKKWYGVKHQEPRLLREAVYGLTELFRKKIGRARLIANPGCYPTGALLGAVPLLQKKLVQASPIIIDAKSGVSGAGKKLKPHTQFAELENNFYAYKVNQHQHAPEIEQILNGFSSKKIGLTFVPHLLPIHRGILSVIYLNKRPGVRVAQIQKAYDSFYQNATFVRVKSPGEFPMLKDVVHTNFCDIGYTIDEKKGQVIVITAIDNLLKGASGQAVQNMNVCLGLDEHEGILG